MPRLQAVAQKLFDTGQRVSDWWHMELTVREIAERILPVSPDGDMEALVRKLRHWTLSGVLRPVGSLHTGAGRHRKYEETEIYFAGLAVELTRWRIPVGISDRIIELARKEHFQIDAKPTAKPMTFVKDAVDGKEDTSSPQRSGRLTPATCRADKN